MLLYDLRDEAHAHAGDGREIVASLTTRLALHAPLGVRQRRRQRHRRGAGLADCPDSAREERLSGHVERSQPAATPPVPPTPEIASHRPAAVPPDKKAPKAPGPPVPPAPPAGVPPSPAMPVVPPVARSPPVPPAPPVPAPPTPIVMPGARSLPQATSPARIANAVTPRIKVAVKSRPPSGACHDPANWENRSHPTARPSRLRTSVCRRARSHRQLRK